MAIRSPDPSIYRILQNSENRPSMYKPLEPVPQKTSVKSPLRVRAPRGGLYLEVALKYKVKKAKTVNILPTISYNPIDF